MNDTERETIIRIGYGDRAAISIWSTQRAVWSKCRKAGWLLVSESKTARGRVCGQEWEGKPSDLTFSCKKPGRKKIVTGFAINPGNRGRGPVVK